MRARRGGIHLGSRDGARRGPRVHRVADLLEGAHGLGLRALDEGAIGRRAHFQIVVRLGIWIEQIADLFVVDLHHRKGDLQIDVACGELGLLLEDGVAHLRHDALVRPVADKRVRLTRASLAIRKQAAVEALESVIEHALAQAQVHEPLIGVLHTKRARRRPAAPVAYGIVAAARQAQIRLRFIEDIEAIVAPVREVEGKLLFLLLIRVGDDRGWSLHANDALGIALLLTAVEGTHAHGDLDRLGHRLKPA